MRISQYPFAVQALHELPFFSYYMIIQQIQLRCILKEQEVIFPHIG